ncbi:MAG TPA: ABC transporter permease, partial [Gemmatimonadaceae bacterium]|nr:ABC transporter permease [Gemmatimonadaceae bacterium]
MPFHRTVVWLTRRQLFARRRVYVALVVMLIPALIAALVRFNAGEGDLDAVGSLSTIYKEIVLGVLLPLTALVFGTSAFGGEVDDGTLIYLMVKPVPRWQLTFSKYLVALMATLAVVIPAILLAWLAMQNGAPVRVPLAYAAGALVGSMIYCAIFVTLGITSRRALAIGLLYIVAFENVLSRSIIGVKSLSVREFSIAVCRKVAGTTVEFTDFTVPMSTVYTVGTLFFVMALGMGFA